MRAPGSSSTTLVTENVSAADEPVEAIRARDGQAIASRDSVSEWTSAQRIVQTALDSFGRIDIVVNNAGVLSDAIFHRVSVNAWRSSKTASNSASRSSISERSRSGSLKWR